MSRHIVAACARELAESGYVVMIPDLTGCGDGSGDFSDATWSIWREDMLHALAFMQTSYALPVTLWGLRLGGLMAAQLATERTDISRLLLWQPVLNGEQQIDQFLRLEAAAMALRDGEFFDRRAMWEALRGGESLEVAGYCLPPRLALEMAEVRLGNLAPKCEVHWLDLTPTGSVAPAALKVSAAWQDCGVSVTHAAVVGEPFWRTIDARANTVLQAQTVALLYLS